MHFIAEDSFHLLYDLYSIQRLFFLIFTKGANGVSWDFSLELLIKLLKLHTSTSHIHSLLDPYKYGYIYSIYMNFSYPLGKFLLINCLPAMASVSIVLRHFICSTSSVCLHLLHCVNLICNKLKTTPIIVIFQFLPNPQLIHFYCHLNCRVSVQMATLNC